MSEGWMRKSVQFCLYAYVKFNTNLEIMLSINYTNRVVFKLCAIINFYTKSAVNLMSFGNLAPLCSWLFTTWYWCLLETLHRYVRGCLPLDTDVSLNYVQYNLISLVWHLKLRWIYRFSFCHETRNNLVTCHLNTMKKSLLWKVQACRKIIMSGFTWL
jgi:hypothetical protein